MVTIGNRQIQGLLQKLSPQQIQMIKLLELPAIQLEQRIKQEIEENPVLEESENSSNDDIIASHKVNIDDIKDDYTPNYRLYVNNQSKDDKHGTIPLSNSLSLTEFLEQQLCYYELTELEKIVCSYIIGSLDSNGYLRRDNESIVDDLAFMHSIEVEVEDIEDLVKVVQKLEPAGVCARDLRESLLIQLKRKEQSENVKLAYKVLDNYFDYYSKKHYEKIINRMNITEAQLRSVISVIVSLSPKPANQYAELLQSEPTIQIIPDFVLDNENGVLDLSLNRYNAPDIKINSTYVNMLEEMVKSNKRQKSKGENCCEEDKEAIGFIRQKIDSARWFMSAIKQRDATLMLTMHSILEFQRAYFEDGDQTKLRPMILKDIAERTSLDVSTISRVVNSKYIQTHFGIFPLKFFFSEAMFTESGEEVSSREIKQILSECVANENKRKPLTDEALMIILRERGYQIARRTVAKYREMLGIAVARLRREII
ncbi:MAG: RNA polymerase factor sigma-54 [Rikenellaceae bacterium]